MSTYLVSLVVQTIGLDGWNRVWVAVRVSSGVIADSTIDNTYRMVGREKVSCRCLGLWCGRKRRHKDDGVSRDGRCSEMSVCDWKSGRCELDELNSRETTPLFMLSDGEFSPTRRPHFVTALCRCQTKE